MIETDIIIINSTLIVPVYVLTYCDGIKEEVDISNHTIFLWYDEHDNFETWLKIRAHSPDIIKAYLSNKLGIMDVIESSSVALYKRSFDNYKELHKYKKLDNLEEIEFPENELLGQDFISLLNAERAIKTTFVSQDNSPLSLNEVTFKQRYTTRMVETKVTSSNNASLEVFKTMAA
jgi:hypothetical protein